MWKLRVNLIISFSSNVVMVIAVQYIKIYKLYYIKIFNNKKKILISYRTKSVYKCNIVINLQVFAGPLKLWKRINLTASYSSSTLNVAKSYVVDVEFVITKEVEKKHIECCKSICCWCWICYNKRSRKKAHWMLQRHMSVSYTHLTLPTNR